MSTALEATLDPSLRSWVDAANHDDCDFPIQNLPWGVFRAHGSAEATIGVAIGDAVLDVRAAVETQALHVDGDLACALCATTLNPLMAKGPDQWRAARIAISALLAESAPARHELLHAMNDVAMCLPMDIGDYTDFYAARHHATNVGRMFRPDGDPLMPNYLHLPVGYHGRASSVVVSGTGIVRPHGQLKPDDGPPVFDVCRLLDYELEFGAVIGTGNALGDRVPMADAMSRIFGLVILNDWSARDVQKWEYQPLGPFNAKNFASSISPWVVTIDALTPFRTAGPARDADDPAVLEYLHPVTDDVLDVRCAVHLASAQMRAEGTPAMEVSRGTLADLTWTFSQMLAHHTSTGCPMRPGDLIGSGTVSGLTPESRGCLLERTWRGTEPLDLPDGTQRRFLLDGDELTITAWCEGDGHRRIGLGQCVGVIEPAR